MVCYSSYFIPISKMALNSSLRVLYKYSTIGFGSLLLRAVWKELVRMVGSHPLDCYNYWGILVNMVMMQNW